MTRITHAFSIFTLGLGLALAGCSGDDPAPDDGGVTDTGVTPDSGVAKTLTAITLIPSTVELEPGETTQLTVTATYDDGSTENPTSGVTFETSDSSVVLVDTVGELTAVAEGSATITATYEGETATSMVTVMDDVVPGLVVFDDEFGAGIAVQDFGGATNVIAPDTAEAQAGTASLKIDVPSSGYTGAAFRIDTAQDLSGYDALVFWAKADAAHTVDVFGIGNDATNTTYQAEAKAISVGTDWARYVVPLPDPAALSAEQGLFHFAEGGDEGAYTLWIDEMRYTTLGAELANFRPSISSASVNLAAGATANVEGFTLVVAVDGTDQTLEPAVAYFTFASSDTGVATVAADGTITAVAEGTASITAKLGATDASGAVTVTVGATPTELVVFADDYGTDISFADFGGATNAITLDTTEAHSGAASLKIEVPAAGYTGGAMVIGTPQSLAGFDALTFWAKASADNALNVSGIANDGNANTLQAEYNGVPLTSTWTRFVIPLPDPSQLVAVSGLFHFAEGSEHGAYTIWLDDIAYTTLGAAITNPRPQFATEAVSRAVGETFQVNGNSVIYDVEGADQVIAVTRPYFDYTSSDTNVATIDANGMGMAVAAGTAEITASLAGTAATGTLTVTVVDATTPTAAAPTPTVPAADVISLFSNAYTDVAVDTWSASWDSADVADTTVAGDDVKLYTNMVFAGVEFTTTTVNATNMTHFHMDIWAASGTVFRVKLVDFGPGGVFGGGDDTEHELTFDAASTPALVTGQWLSLDIPLTQFANMTNRTAIAQMVIAGDTSTVYVDNVYFYNGGMAPTMPSAPAPAPTQAAADVISMFSDAYTDVAVDTWSAVWDQADVADVSIMGDAVKEYTNFVFAGVEATTTPINASGMTHFHMDVWAPAGTVFRVKLVDFGPGGVFGGGDDTEHELTFDAASTPALVTGQWLSLDIPLSQFANMTNRTAIAQLVMSGDTSTVYIDNVYFYDGGMAPTTPTTAAPTPSLAAANVISLFSDAYTDVAVDTWSAVWDQADVADVTVATDNVKLYTNFVFAGIEFTTTPVNASAMTHFHADIWVPAGTVFRVKLVDFGAGGVFGGGDDTEHELTFDAASTPALVTGQWVSLDIPFTQFVNLTNRTALAQLIFSGDTSTVYVDNVYFHN